MDNQKIAFIVESPDRFGGVETIYRNLDKVSNLYLFKTKWDVLKNAFLSYQEKVIVLNMPFSTFIFCIFNLRTLIKRDKKVYYLVHINFEEGKFFRSLFKSLFFVFLNIFSIKTIAFSKMLIENLNIKNKQIVFPPCFKSSEIFKSRKQINWKDREIDFLYLGRLEYQKGADLLTDIADLLPSKLNIVGSGRIPLSSPNLIMHGSKSLNEVYEFLSKTKILVMPSRFEGFGLVILEAIAHGCKVVCFDCDYGPRDLKREFEPYITLTPPMDISSMAESCIKNLNENDLLEIPFNKLESYTSDSFIKSII